MKDLKLFYENVMENKIGRRGFTAEDTLNEQSLTANIHDAVEKKRESMIWRGLPYQPDSLIDDIINTADDIRKKFDNFVVFGIGGSALGPYAVFNALKHLRYNLLDPVKRDGPRYFVEDNIDPERMDSLFDIIDLRSTMFNVVSKSGNTLETLAQLMLVTNKLKEKGLDLSEHLVITTSGQDGYFSEIAKKERIKKYIIPDGVGGRFSVLCPVGLLSAAVLGIDIKQLLQGAARMDKLCCENESNIAVKYALYNIMAYRKGANIAVLMPYAESLRYFSDWFAQLWGESLGKRLDNNGQEVYVGQTPVKALGVTDQHSQLQLFTEGPYDKIITLLEVGKYHTDNKIHNEYPFIKGLSFLNRHNFSELVHAELSGTVFSLVKAQRMNMTIQMPEVNPYTIGQLIYFFEMATAYAGEMLNINAFDQPGVETGKKAAFKNL